MVPIPSGACEKPGRETSVGQQGPGRRGGRKIRPPDAPGGHAWLSGHSFYASASLASAARAGHDAGCVCKRFSGEGEAGNERMEEGAGSSLVVVGLV